MEEIGERLRHRRRERGLSLQDAEAGTKIRRTYLEALEEGRLLDLPAEVYTKGFLRSYGDFLGLDGSALVAEFKASRMSPEADDFARPLPVRSARRSSQARARRAVGPSGASGASVRAIGTEPRRRARAGWPWAVVAALLFAALAVYGAHVGRVHSGLSGPVPAGGQAAGGQGASGRAGSGGSPAGGGSGQGAAAAGSAAGQGLGGAVAATTVTPQPPQGTILPFAVRGARSIVARAVLTGRCWVEVWQDNGPPRQAMLTPGQSTTWTASRQLRVLVGNPAVLDLTVDGQPLARLPGSNPWTLVFTLTAA